MQEGRVPLFKLRISQYINENIDAHNMTYKKLSELSGVPMSTLHSYAQGKTSTPNEDNLIRIAAVFGDAPAVIQEMRKEAKPSTEQENMLRAKSSDPELLEKYATIIRSNVSQILEEYRVQSAAQQTEIIQHADQRVEDAKAEASAQCKKVAEQCFEHEREYKNHCDQIIAAERRAAAAEAKGSADLILRLEQNIVYLRTLVRNLSLVAALFGAYSLYAYKTFDIEDPTRGLHQGGTTNLPLILIVVVLCLAFASIVASFMSKKLNKSDPVIKGEHP